jgi:hypothetical protein
MPRITSKAIKASGGQLNSKLEKCLGNCGSKPTGRLQLDCAAVPKAAGPGEPVTQEVAASVKGEVDCSIKGTVVASYDKAALITEGKLQSADDVYGVRFANNTEFYSVTASK